MEALAVAVVIVVMVVALRGRLTPGEAALLTLVGEGLEDGPPTPQALEDYAYLLGEAGVRVDPRRALRFTRKRRDPYWGVYLEVNLPQGPRLSPQALEALEKVRSWTRGFRTDYGLGLLADTHRAVRAGARTWKDLLRAEYPEDHLRKALKALLEAGALRPWEWRDRV